jgi:large subunit ribosomal protein L25
METIKLNGQKRATVGKRSSKDDRNNDMVPCNLYGHGQNDAFSVDYNELAKAIYTDQLVIAEITVDGTTKNAIIKEIQFNSVTDKVMHVDFQQLIKGEKVKCEIPLVSRGFAKGQQAGGKLEMKLRKVKVKADADKIPTKLEVDVTNLELGKSLRIRDIEAAGIEILNPAALPVVTITIPRALRGQQNAQQG